MKRAAWKVSDVMTSEVISVPPDAPYKRIAALLAEHRISAVPVVDAKGRVVGIVSEADLLPKIGHLHLATGYPLESRRHRHEAELAAALTAADLMSSPVTRLVGDATVAAAARLLYSRGMRRLPVVDSDGRLVGILSRRDLLKAFLRPDAEIEAELRDRLADAAISVTVREGVAHLEGRVRLSSEAAHALARAAATAGVVGVENELSCDVDDYALSVPVRLMT